MIISYDTVTTRKLWNMKTTLIQSNIIQSKWLYYIAKLAYKVKELSLCHKHWFSYLYIFLTWWRKALIFQTKVIWPSRIHNLKYLRPTTLGCKDIEIWKSEFVAKTQFLCISTVHTPQLLTCLMCIGLLQIMKSRLPIPQFSGSRCINILDIFLNRI